MSVLVRYSPDIEQPIENEEQVHRDLIDSLRSITETTSKSYGHAVRSVHANSHGFMQGELAIAPNLAPELAQGLFAQGGTYGVVMRISTSPGDILDDAVSAPRGLAIKILDVPGERLPESQGETAQNLVLVNAPALAAPDAKAFLGSMPIEDASLEWDQKESPYRTIGRIVVFPQIAWSVDRARVVDDEMFFSPWHGIVAHRPLGSVNRSRRQAYEMSAEFRGRFNSCPVREPRGGIVLPG